MARSVPPGRVQHVAQAAARVFISKGYRRTLMADVATAAGLSSGSMYTYVESKEALFHLALLYAMTPDDADGLDAISLPMPTPAAGETLSLIDKWLGDATAFPALRAGLARKTVADPEAELTAIVAERYAAIERSRRLLALLEQSALDLPEVSALYYERSRRGQVDDLMRYVERRTKAGIFRPTPDSATAARFIIEAIAWFAWHRKGDPDSAMITDEQARSTVVHMIAAALLP